ncbi:MAG: protein kinase [Planctomycetales bacterium]|nr:protein kinase [Planctomycetales bacterium]
MDESNLDDETIDESLLQAQLQYDSTIASAENIEVAMQMESAIGEEFAKTIRLLHDVLGITHDNTEVGSSGNRPHWELPQPFGRFQTIEKLGQGAFGAVWKAYDPVLNRYVAIKALHPDLRQVSAFQERFEHEAQAAARLNHTNIVRVFEVGSFANISYLVTEFIEGAPLQIFRSGKLAFTPTMAARLIAQLADAIYHSHQHGVLHRDIKPENILIGSTLDDCLTQTPRLTDFGLARLVDQQSSTSSTGMLVGSFDYMAPEQLMGLTHRIGPQADIYALGVLLFQLLTGRLPRQTDGNIFQAVEASRRLPNLRVSCPNVSRDLEAICFKCLAFDLEARFLSAKELRDDLNNYLEDRPTITRPLSRAEAVMRWSTAHRAAALAIFLVTCSILTALFVSLYASYELTKRNGELASARVASSEAESVAQEHEARFRELAWNSGLQLAFGELERGQLRGLSLALKLLANQHRDAIQRPAWKLLNAELEIRYSLLLTEPVPLREVVAIPHTNLLAISGDQPSIIIYDYSTNKIQRRISAPIEQIHALAASPDGKLLAIGGSTRPDIDLATPLIVDLSTGFISQTDIFGPTTIESLKFSPDGKRLAIGFRYEDVRVVDLESPGTPAIVLPASRRCRAVDWLSEHVLAVHSTHGSLSIANLQTVQSDTIDCPNEIETFAVAKASGWICTSNALNDGCTLVSIENPSARLSLTGSLKSSKCLAFSPSEKWIAAGTDLGELIVWEIPDENAQNLTSGAAAITPNSRRVIMGSGITSLTWIEDSLVLVGESGEVVKWSVPNAEVLPDSAVTIAATFTTPEQLALIPANGEVTLVDLGESTVDQLVTSTLPLAQVAQTFGVQSCSIGNIVAPNPERLLASTTGCSAGKLFLLKLPELITETSFDLPMSADSVSHANCILCEQSQDGKWLAWGCGNRELSIVNLETNQVDFKVEMTGVIYGFRFLNSRLIGVAGQFEGLRVFDLVSKQQVVSLGTTHSCGIFVDQSSNSITVGFKDGILRSWLIETWQPTFELRTNESLIESVCQNVDGSLGVSIDEQSNVVVFSPSHKLVYGRLRENLRIRELYSHTRMTCQFSPDGKRLLLLLVFMKNEQIKTILQIYDLGPDLIPNV